MSTRTSEEIGQSPRLFLLNTFLLGLVLTALGLVVLSWQSEVNASLARAQELTNSSATYIERTVETVELSNRSLESVGDAMRSSAETMRTSSQFLDNLASREEEYDAFLEQALKLVEAFHQQCKNTRSSFESFKDRPGEIRKFTEQLAETLDQVKQFVWKVNAVTLGVLPRATLDSIDKSLTEAVTQLKGTGSWIGSEAPKFIQDSVRTLAASEKQLALASEQVAMLRKNDLPHLAKLAREASVALDRSAMVSERTSETFDKIQKSELPTSLTSLKTDANRLRELARPVGQVGKLYVLVGAVLLVVGCLAVLLSVPMIRALLVQLTRRVRSALSAPKFHWPS